MYIFRGSIATQNFRILFAPYKCAQPPVLLMVGSWKMQRWRWPLVAKFIEKPLLGSNVLGEEQIQTNKMIP